MTTRWSLILQARGDSAESAEASEQLCRQYWYPLFSFARFTGCRREEAEDLTQGFFAQLLERGSLRTISRTGGRFRSFLLVAFKNYLASRAARQRRQKRGGGQVHLSLEEPACAGQIEAVSREGVTPDRLFDRDWALVIISRVHGQLRGEYEKAGRMNVYEKLVQFLPGDEAPETQVEAARALRLREGTFRMELIEGSDLAEVFEQRTLPPDATAHILQAVARAVQYAHEHQVIHRDLKPSKVLVDAAGEPHITDFGLARRTDVQAGMTASGRLLGTPGYWAPEQLEEGGSPAVAGDVYALGAMLYAGLTGRPPFLADNLEALLFQITSVDPIALRRLNPDIPRDLETISLKCLDKRPTQRYASAGDLAEELGRFLEGMPIDISSELRRLRGTGAG